MLYTRFVIGEETLSSTRVFNFSHWAIFSIATKSFIFSFFNGHYRPPDLYLRERHTSSGIVWPLCESRHVTSGQAGMRPLGCIANNPAAMWQATSASGRIY